MSNVGNRQQGVGHVGMIVVLVVVAAVAASGYFVWKKHSENAGVDPAVAAALKNVKCDLSDKDLCKFFTSFKAQKYSTINSTTTADGKTNTSLIQSEGTDKAHIKLTGDVNYETITIGTVVYTKNTTDNSWWKQKVQPADVSKYDDQSSQPNFSEPAQNDTKQPTYKKLGTEACGKLTCFKYQVIDPNSPSTTEYIWFDTKAYQLRRDRTVDGTTTTDSTFDYTTVTISAPSPVKELGPNQYLVPGQSQPVTIPTADTSAGAPSAQDLQNLQNLAQQYQQSYPQ
ncbi:MAG TPA: hypothetical protein VKQ34_04805 [Candidatus Saccharimonadales bacterium]|nr:hypothetical protein [Candidatus Saccharimonadales bacterium]